MKIQTINITDVTLDYGGNHNNRKLVDKNCITDSKVINQDDVQFVI